MSIFAKSWLFLNHHCQQGHMWMCIQQTFMTTEIWFAHSNRLWNSLVYILYIRDNQISSCVLKTYFHCTNCRYNLKILYMVSNAFELQLNICHRIWMYLIEISLYHILHWIRLHSSFLQLSNTNLIKRRIHVCVYVSTWWICTEIDRRKTYCA